jgi:hypothetical protein
VSRGHEHLPELARPVQLHQRHLGCIAAVDKGFEGDFQRREHQRVEEVFSFSPVPVRVLPISHNDAGA